MDLDHLHKLITLAKSLEIEEQADNRAEEQKTSEDVKSDLSSLLSPQPQQPQPEQVQQI
jgi:hypothetical protein